MRYLLQYVQQISNYYFRILKVNLRFTVKKHISAIHLSSLLLDYNKKYRACQAITAVSKHNMLSNKIREVRKDILKKTQYEFAKMLGFSRIATISDYEKGKRSPDVTTLRKIAALGNVSMDWLTHDEHENEELVSPNKGQIQHPTPININVYDSLSPKSLQSLQSIQTNSISHAEPVEKFFIPEKYHSKDILAIKFEGDSMAPAITNGSIVGIDKSNKSLKSGRLYALWIEHEGLTIRRIFVYPGRVELSADNEKFPKTEIPSNKISDDMIVGAVSWVFQVA